MGVPAREREAVGQRIKRLRKERGLSQISLAEQVGVTDAWISQVEKERAMPSAELLNNIASVLKIPIRELLQDEEAHLELTTRIKLVEVLLETNQPDEAETIILGLLHHSQLSDVGSIKLTVHHAECKYQQKQYDESLDLLLPLVQRLEAANYHDAHVLAWIHNQIGKAYFKRQEFTAAFYRFQKAHDLISRFTQFDALAAKIAYNVGITMRRIRRVRDSIAYLEQARNFAAANRNFHIMGHTLLGQGVTYKSIKDYARASECFEQAKAIFQNLNLMSFFNEVRLIAAYSILVEKDPQLALEQLQECYEMFQEANDYPAMSFVMAKMAAVYLQVGNEQRAYVCLQQGDELVKSYPIQQTPEVAELYRSFASYYMYCGDFDRSVEYALKSAELFGNINHIHDQVDSLQVAGEAYRKIGDLGLALQTERKCVQLLKEL